MKDITNNKGKLYLGNCELITQNENSLWNTFISGPMGVFAAVTGNGTTESLRYIYKDHLGSWTTITDDAGTVLQELSFDAWGNLRSAETWRAWGQLPEPMFDRGFTGHEHLYAFGLINMNGRMYDPQMSSFLSVDAYVQSPENSQSFNRYTYCMNNPLKYVDPSGWVMVGGMTPGNPFHENWSVNYGVPVHGSSDFNNAYYKLNMALYGNMDGLCGGGPYESGGMGILSSYQAAMKYYQSASPNMVWSFSHLINNYVNNPSVFNRRELLDAGVTDYTYKTWWTAEGQGGYQYTISFNQGSFSYGNDNYNFGYKGYLDATIWAMDLSRTTSGSGFLSALSFINSVSGTIIGNNTNYYNTPERYKELGASLRPKLKKIGHPMRNASTRVIGESVARNFGRLNTAIGVIGIGLSVADIINQGELTYANGFNLTMCTLCAFCPAGWIISGVWIVSDILSYSYTGNSVSDHIGNWLDKR